MEKWYQLKIEPRDVLFFPDARPMYASSVGEGARWPVPQVFHNAILSMLHTMERQTFEHEHHAGEKDKNQNSSFRFGGLQTVGVFPVLHGKLCVPTPADIQPYDDSGKLTVLEPVEKGMCDLPAPLTKVLTKPGKPTKQTIHPWMYASDLEKYLSGELNDINLIESEDIFDKEVRPGIGIDAHSGSVEEGKLYLAEYLRLKPDVSLIGFAQCRQRRYKDGIDKDLLASFFDGKRTTPFIFGGQRGVAFLETTRESYCARMREMLPTGKYIKWVLLTPAIFCNGWLPSWIQRETGRLLTGDVEKPPRKSGETRAEWRARFKKSEVNARLVAACVPKPFAYSGWRVHGGRVGKEGAHPTRLCVPAGAVYYFETEEPEKLVKYLHGKARSDELAEKGFGFGVCGIWK